MPSPFDRSPLRRGRLAACALLATAGAALAAAPAHASWRAPCREGGNGPKCTFWNARATFIADGDTIKARVEGGPESLIRFNGINAMELTHYNANARQRRGACHGLEAAAFVERYVRGSHWNVRLAAQHASSRSGGRHRLRRSVWVRSGGRWRDLAKLEMQAGLALWLPNPHEWAHNGEYHVLAARAIRAHRRLYDPDSCGAGPAQSTPISVVVNWDADGNDEQALNGEWVEIRNGGDRPLSLRGWRVRDSWQRYTGFHTPGYLFPPATVVQPHGAIRVHVGCGPNHPFDLFWCQHASAFENVTGGRLAIGDGAYLFDPDGDLRAAFDYPCVVGCADPLKGRVRLSVHPSTPEVIALENVSSTPANLADYTVKLALPGRSDAFIFGYPLGLGTVLQPGETLLISPGAGPNTRLERSLFRGFYVLSDGGGVVTLRTLSDMITDCVAWGGAGGRGCHHTTAPPPPSGRPCPPPLERRGRCYPRRR